MSTICVPGSASRKRCTIRSRVFRSRRCRRRWTGTIRRRPPGDPLPPLWHWLYFLPTARQSALGPDGHPARGGFLPPVPLPRRMWAGGRFTFHQPLRVDETITRVSTVQDVTVKHGRNGALCFVLVRHEIVRRKRIGFGRGARHRLSRCARSRGRQRRRRGRRGRMMRGGATIGPSDPLLFRYSALTFNSHRIHYDRRYVTETEGYPGLIVHGPLIATLLIDLLRRNTDRTVASFRFRAVSPLFDIAPFSVHGAPGARVSRCGRAMQTATWRWRQKLPSECVTTSARCRESCARGPDRVRRNRPATRPVALLREGAGAARGPSRREPIQEVPSDPPPYAAADRGSSHRRGSTLLTR